MCGCGYVVSRLAWVALCCAAALPAAPILAATLESEDEVIVGFLQTEKETYPEELTFSNNIAEMFTKLGARVVRVDYNKIVKSAHIKKASLEEATKNGANISTLDAGKIRREVENFLKREGISRVFIPGNFYNLDANPYPPTPNRQLVTAAITEIARENPSMRLMGVCGGLQGVAHALGIKIVRVQHLVGENQAKSHMVSEGDPQKKGVDLHRLRVVPGSRLANIISRHALLDRDGWPYLFFPDLHGGAVGNDLENVKKLESLGYKIVGYSDDGVIEALEDMHGNILFQGHPEALAIYALDNNLAPLADHDTECTEAHDYSCERYRAAMSAILIMEDFLHR